MSLTTTTTKKVYTPNGVDIEFEVPFPIFAATGVECITVDELGREEVLTDYIVRGYGTGVVEVVFASPPPSGKKLVVRRATPPITDSRYPESGKFPAKTVEGDLDRLMGLAQEFDERLGLALQAPADSEGMGYTATEMVAAMETYADTTVAAAQSGAASAASASASAEMAHKWANNPEDTEVTGGQFSAYHWMKKTEDISSGGSVVREDHKGVVSAWGPKSATRPDNAFFQLVPNADPALSPTAEWRGGQTAAPMTGFDFQQYTEPGLYEYPGISNGTNYQDGPPCVDENGNLYGGVIEITGGRIGVIQAYTMIESGPYMGWEFKRIYNAATGQFTAWAYERYLVESWESDDGVSWYRRYSDNWKAQGGQAVAPTTVPFLIKFASKPKFVVPAPLSGGTGTDSSIDIVISGITNTQFVAGVALRNTGSTAAFLWRAEGY